MTRHHFSLKESFVFGWTKTKQHYWFIFLSFLIYAIILSATSHARFPFLNAITLLIVGFSIASITLQISRNHSFTFADLFTPLLSPERVIKYLALAVLYIIPMVLLTAALFAPLFTQSLGKIGAILLMVPAVYLIVRFKFFPYVVLDNEKASIGELIRLSLKITNNHFWKLFLFLSLVAIFNALGAAAAVIGLAVTIPVSIFATVCVYNKLKEHSF
jgi:uncharacterized membrane protein